MPAHQMDTTVQTICEECICAYLVLARGHWICSFRIAAAPECLLVEFGKCAYPRGPFKPELND